MDRNITAINFLQYTDEEWDRYAANHWAYHNRLRMPEYQEIYRKTGQEILKWTTDDDQRALAAMPNGFPRFQDFAPEALVHCHRGGSFASPHPMHFKLTRLIVKLSLRR